MSRRVLAVRQDNNGDVLLAGPAFRALASAATLTLLCGPRGVAAASLLPGIDDLLVEHNSWIDAIPEPIGRTAILAFVDRIAARDFDEAIIFTSFHQSALPMALLLRMAGIARLGAISVDYPGTLLDVRHAIDDDVHEVERALSLARACGYDLPPHDDGRLAIALDARPSPIDRPYFVVHPGATVPARAWFPERNRELVARLARSGRRVVVTGGNDERELTAYVAGSEGYDLGGQTNFVELARIVRDASAIVVGNTGAAHVAAAVGTPVVSLFPPTIPAVRFRPWRVAHALLGVQDISCRGCRARICPFENQPCLAAVSVDDVLASLDQLVGRIAS